MPAAIGPRFVLEAGFLILLAAVVGLADLSPALIILVMTVGWLLVALIEYFAWRQSPGFPGAQRVVTAEAPPPAVREEVVEDVAPPPPPATVREEVVEDVAPPPPPSPPPAEEETIVVTPEAEPPALEPEPVRDFLPETAITHRLEPLQPRPRRRWIIFGPYQRPAASAEGNREEER
jgi:hypothetical protein